MIYKVLPEQDKVNKYANRTLQMPASVAKMLATTEVRRSSRVPIDGWLNHS
jgi:hypothetical protein